MRWDHGWWCPRRHRDVLPSNNTITYDPATLQHAHDSIGDFASGVLIASAWSSSVQHELAHDLGTTAARKGAECLAGAWAADRATSLSPGDLDEAVTLLVAGSVPERQIGNHESTDRGSAFRAGGGVPCGLQARPVEVRAVQLTPLPLASPGRAQRRARPGFLAFFEPSL